MKKTILIAAASSGSGKTTITMGLLRAIARKGYDVQPFKCGPDYIDPQYHHIACSKASINLDIWMNGEDAVSRIVSASTADINIIEGAMGLYDGADGMTGSAAHVAETVGAEVVLVVDGQSMAHSVAPLLYGYMHWRPRTNVRAIIFNNVGSIRHEQALRRAAQEVGIECLGCIPRQKTLYSPSRHLGLDILEQDRIASLAEQVAEQIEAHVNLEWLVENISPTPYRERKDCNEQTPVKTLYMARDEAFNFIYAETIQLLSKDYRIKYFSPLRNECVGEDADAIYLPGGYPELFLDSLGRSFRTMRSLQTSKARIVAECGGMMYLSRAIDGVHMVGLLPWSATMEGAHLHLGYRSLNWKGTELRGHEFHYSSLIDAPQSSATLLNAQGTPVDTLFYMNDNIIASYVHWSPSSLSILF